MECCGLGSGLAPELPPRSSYSRILVTSSLQECCLHRNLKYGEKSLVFHHFTLRVSGAVSCEVARPRQEWGHRGNHSSMCCQGTVLGTGAGLGADLDPGAPSRAVPTGFAGDGPSLGQVPAEGAEAVPRPQNPLELLDVAFPGFVSCWWQWLGRQEPCPAFPRSSCCPGWAGGWHKSLVLSPLLWHWDNAAEPGRRCWAGTARAQLSGLGTRKGLHTRRPLLSPILKGDMLGTKGGSGCSALAPGW